MVSLPRALALSLSQLGDPAIVKVLVKSVLVTLAIFAVLGIGLWAALDSAIETWLAANMPEDYSDTLAAVAALTIGLVAGWLLFRIVALFVLQFYADEIVRAVEARHYPHAAKVAGLPFREELGNSLRSALRAVLVNLVALPFAIALLVTGIGTAVLFWAVNGWLLGRELQDMVWLRHRSDKAEIAPMSAGQRFLLGGTIAGIMLVPIANLLAPVLGAASATHMVHRARGAHA
ncbi:EI24 domain-containing protein [Qipengyuania gaetbuli]|uniref:EI24 domain-containing protein n=1 Tax=Qipengyuania gaetbuli TaxID=266952 RepID=UPI001C99F3A3|nr:EI24 domain-containing protein [Qipengyuania gaetbuli]MBY6015230.1 EI24 domain-containing protein [Qipengyuania gaetbuli]